MSGKRLRLDFPYGCFMSSGVQRLFRFREYHVEITGTDSPLSMRDCSMRLRNSEFDTSLKRCSWISPNSIHRLILRRMYGGKDIRYPGNWDGKKFCMLADSIEVNGVLNPITVISDKDMTSYAVIRGCHRAACCLYLNIYVPAHILDQVK